MSCKDNKDGSCSVEYIPFTPGEYDVNITFGGLPIVGEISNQQHNKPSVEKPKGEMYPCKGYKCLWFESYNCIIFVSVI